MFARLPRPVGAVNWRRRKEKPKNPLSAFGGKFYGLLDEKLKEDCVGGDGSPASPLSLSGKRSSSFLPLLPSGTGHLNLCLCAVEVLSKVFVRFVQSHLDGLQSGRGGLVVRRSLLWRFPLLSQAYRIGKWVFSLLSLSISLSISISLRVVSVGANQWNVRRNNNSAWPVANPVFTCASPSDAGSPSNFVADPFLYINVTLHFLNLHNRVVSFRKRKSDGVSFPFCSREALYICSLKPRTLSPCKETSESQKAAIMDRHGFTWVSYSMRTGISLTHSSSLMKTK